MLPLILYIGFTTTLVYLEYKLENKNYDIDGYM